MVLFNHFQCWNCWGHQGFRPPLLHHTPTPPFDPLTSKPLIPKPPAKRFLGLFLGLAPSTSISMHFFTQDLTFTHTQSSFSFLSMITRWENVIPYMGEYARELPIELPTNERSITPTQPFLTFHLPLFWHGDCTHSSISSRHCSPSVPRLGAVARQALARACQTSPVVWTESAVLTVRSTETRRTGTKIVRNNSYVARAVVEARSRRSNLAGPAARSWFPGIRLDTRTGSCLNFLRYNSPRSNMGCSNTDWCPRSTHNSIRCIRAYRRTDTRWQSPCMNLRYDKGY